MYFLVPATSRLFIFSFYFHAIPFISCIIKNTTQFLVVITFENAQTFFLLFFHPPILFSRVKSPCFSCSSRQTLLCSKGKLRPCPKHCFISVPHQQKSSTEISIWRNWSTYFHITGVGKTVKSRGLRGFVLEAKTYFNQNTHYASYSWFILCTLKWQGQ